MAPSDCWVSDRKTGTDQRPLPARDRGLGRVRWLRGRHARGDVIIVRFADDFTAGFEYQEDAQRFLADLRQRFAKFGLELHPDKTRLIKFGRHAAWRRAERDVGKPETFDFLGFTHLCATTAAVAVCQQPERLICAVAAGRRSAAPPAPPVPCSPSRLAAQQSAEMRVEVRLKLRSAWPSLQVRMHRLPGRWRRVQDHWPGRGRAARRFCRYRIRRPGARTTPQ